MTHATLSPSSSSRWLQCTASVEACKQYENKSNPASRWGTACHAMGELMLKEEPHPKTGEMIEGEVVDVEMINTAMAYAAYCRDLITEDTVQMIESKLDLTFIAPNTFGTSDFTALTDTHLDVVDLKTGHGIVWAKDNTQMMLYALGAYRELEDMFDVETITMHIMQSRANHIDTATITIHELLAFEKRAKVIANNIKNGHTTFAPEEKACKWCDHKVNCEALATHAFDTIKGEFDDLTDIDGKADDIPEDHVKKVMDNAKLIKSFIDAVEDRALEMAQAGLKIDGYKLVRGKKNLAWTDIEKAETYMLRKLKQDGTYTRKIITPTQALKALGKDNKFIQKLMARPEGALQLAPLTDKRDAVEPVAQEFDDLDEEL